VCDGRGSRGHRVRDQAAAGAEDDRAGHDFGAAVLLVHRGRGLGPARKSRAIISVMDTFKRPAPDVIAQRRAARKAAHKARQRKRSRARKPSSYDGIDEVLPAGLSAAKLTQKVRSVVSGGLPGQGKRS
jgi:hypothetical protein